MTPGLFAALYGERMNISRAAVVALLAVSLAGCASEAPPEVADPAPIETPVETPTPTPEPTKPAIGEIDITTEGFGYLVPGQPIDDVDPAVALVVFDEEACKDDGYSLVVARWVPNYPEGDEAFYVYTEDAAREGDVQMIVIRTPDITTAEGVGVGSLGDEVLAAYPDARVIPKDGVDVLAVDGTLGKIIFEIQDDHDGSDTVDFVTIVPIGGRDSGIARSGAGATCGA